MRASRPRQPRQDHMPPAGTRKRRSPCAPEARQAGVPARASVPGPDQLRARRRPGNPQAAVSRRGAGLARRRGRLRRSRTGRALRADDARARAPVRWAGTVVRTTEAAMNVTAAEDRRMHPRVSEEGQLLGAYMALLANEGRRRLNELGVASLETPGSRGEMCASCACREGTVPNGCAQTQMDLLKAVVEGGRFLCHAPNDGRMCAGFLAARAA